MINEHRKKIKIIRCPECGSEKINKESEKLVFIDTNQLNGYKWCNDCGFILDGKRFEKNENKR